MANSKGDTMQLSCWSFSRYRPNCKMRFVRRTMLEAGLREDSGQGWGGGWGAAQACGQCWPRLDNTFCTYSSSAHPQFCLLHFLLIITHWSKRKLASSQVEVQSGHVFNAFGVKQMK